MYFRYNNARKTSHSSRNHAPMMRYQSHKQLPLAEFDWPFQAKLDENNRWVDLSKCIPWDELAEAYYRGLSKRRGRPTKDARLVIGAVINKHKLCLSDRETVVPQAICYPTDLSLLNEARVFSEQIIDILYPKTELKAKPRTHRVKARQAHLAIAKQKRPSGKASRRGIKQQLQYLCRNLGHIKRLMKHWPEGMPNPLPRWLMYRYWVIQHLYEQQWEIYRGKSCLCDDRIVSISQPYVRPIIRGKLTKPVEFGAKLSVSPAGEGVACVDHLRWDAFHEGQDLVSQVEAYRKRHGVYPGVVLDDPIYGTRDNRRYLKRHGIHFAGKPLGRPKKVTESNREELKRLKAPRREEYLQRIPIEGKFGQGKNGYRLNYIQAKRADTSVA